MAKITSQVMREVFRTNKVQCHLCENTTELKDGRLTRNDFVYWSQRNRLVLCKECVGSYLICLIADTADAQPRSTWDSAELVFWRTRANIEREQRCYPNLEPVIH